MHKLETLVTPEEVTQYAADLWRTDLFQQSQQDPDGYINNWTEQFAQQPRIFYQMTDAEAERRHFTAWMNAISHRQEYNNPYIADLYYFHEIVHATTITYDPNLDFPRWVESIFTNEREASLESEVAAYFAIPGLRQKTFPFEIWADRYLENRVRLSSEYEDNHELYKENPVEFLRLLTAERIRVMTSPQPEDSVEMDVAKYGDFNQKWADIWKENYRKVEEAMQTFTLIAKTNKVEAIQYLTNWFSVMQGEDVCPFADEARNFAKLFH